MNTKKRSQLDALIEVVLRQKWLVVVLCVAVLVALAMRAGNVTTSNDYRILFDEGNPELAAFEELEALYASTNVVIVALAPESGNVFTRETLDAVESLTDAAWQLPHSSRVDSLTNHFHSAASGDDLTVEPLVEDARQLDAAALEQIADIALNTAEIEGRLVSRDGRIAGLTISFVLPADQEMAVMEINDSLDRLLDEARVRTPTIAYYATGEIIMNRAFSQATEEGFLALVPIAFLLMMAVACVVMRSVVASLSIVVMIVFTVGSTLGVAGWTSAVFTPISAYVPIIVMAITIAYSVHFTVGTLSAMHRGMDKHEAISSSLNSNAYPVFLTSITTIVGFLSLNFAELPPFHTLGNLVAVGVLFNLFFSVTLLPAVLALLPLRARSAEGRGQDFYGRMADSIIRNRRLLLYGAAFVTIILASGIVRIELSDNFTKYFDERHEFRRDTDFIVGNLTGLQTQEYSLDSGEEYGITNPEYLRKIDRFAEWYRDQPGVRHVWTFSDIMKRLNKNMNGDDPDYYRLPDSPELAAQYLLLYELSLPFGRDLHNSINLSKSATRMVVALGDPTTAEQRALAERGHEWLQSNAPGLVVPATGLSVVFSHLTDRNIHAMLIGTATAMAIVSVILMLVFGSLRIGLICLVPNFVPAAAALGIWGHLVGTVGMASAVFTTIAFGIIVDDTIHFMTKYLKARKDDGLSPSDAVRYAFHTAGRALWTTTLVLVLGFLVFVFSGFQASWALGALVSITIAFALVTDFLLLPPLLIALDSSKK